MTKVQHEGGPRTLYSLGNDSTLINHLPKIVVAMNFVCVLWRGLGFWPLSWLHSWAHLTLRMSMLLLFLPAPIRIGWKPYFLFFKLFLLEWLLWWECILEYFFYFWLLRENHVLSEVVEHSHCVLQWHIFSFNFGHEDAEGILKSG